LIEESEEEYNARPSSVSEFVRSSALAVLRLMTSLAFGRRRVGVKALHGDRWLLPRQHFEVHRLLHIGADVPRRQRRLCEILSEESAARMFVNVPAHPGPFDIEIDCVASV
jgi:hypothetical protein